MDRYSYDLLEEVRKLRTEVDELKALLGRRGGLTTASEGWIISNRATPPAPDDGGHLFASGDNPYWRASSGSIYELANAVAPYVSPLSGSVDAAPASYTQTWGSQVTSSINVMVTKINQIPAALITGGLMNPS